MKYYITLAVVFIMFITYGYNKRIDLYVNHRIYNITVWTED